MLAEKCEATLSRHSRLSRRSRLPRHSRAGGNLARMSNGTTSGDATGFPPAREGDLVEAFLGRPSPVIPASPIVPDPTVIPASPDPPVIPAQAGI